MDFCRLGLSESLPHGPDPPICQQ